MTSVPLLYNRTHRYLRPLQTPARVTQVRNAARLVCGLCR